MVIQRLRILELSDSDLLSANFIGVFTSNHLTSFHLYNVESLRSDFLNRSQDLLEKRSEVKDCVSIFL